MKDSVNDIIATNWYSHEHFKLGQQFLINTEDYGYF